MLESHLLLSEFVHEEGFELNQYLTHLFAYVSSHINDEYKNGEPTLKSV